MSIPKRMEGWDLNYAPKKPSEDELKIDKIEQQLFRLNLFPKSEREMIECIEEHHLDVSQFDFPGGSFEMFRANVLAGKYDIKFEDMTDETIEEIRAGIVSGKYSITY